MPFLKMAMLSFVDEFARLDTGPPASVTAPSFVTPIRICELPRHAFKSLTCSYMVSVACCIGPLAPLNQRVSVRRLSDRFRKVLLGLGTAEGDHRTANFAGRRTAISLTSADGLCPVHA